MKLASLLLAPLFAASLLAADPSKILLRGSSISVEQKRASGSATAVAGAITATADTITFDQQNNTLKLEGTVTLEVAGNKVTAKDAVLELPPGEKRLFFLNKDGRVQSSDASNFVQVDTFPVGGPTQTWEPIQTSLVPARR